MPTLKEQLEAVCWEGFHVEINQEEQVFSIINSEGKHLKDVESDNYDIASCYYDVKAILLINGVLEDDSTDSYGSYNWIAEEDCTKCDTNFRAKASFKGWHPLVCPECRYKNPPCNNCPYENRFCDDCPLKKEKH